MPGEDGSGKAAFLEGNAGVPAVEMLVGPFKGGNREILENGKQMNFANPEKMEKPIKWINLFVNCISHFTNCC